MRDDAATLVYCCHPRRPLLLNTTIGVVVTIDQTLDYYRPHLSLLPDLDVFVNTSWRMTSFVMALLLAFRVNRTYERWCATCARTRKHVCTHTEMLCLARLPPCRACAQVAGALGIRRLGQRWRRAFAAGDVMHC